MKLEFGIFGNDLINRAGSVIPATGLMRAYEDKVLEQHRAGRLIGGPSHIQHDMHRLRGWSQIVGLLIDGAAVSMFGEIQVPENDCERDALETVANAFWQHHHDHGMEPYRRELIERIHPIDASGARHFRTEAYAISQTNLAAQLYPELFLPSHEWVDKDGLTDYRMLTKRLKQVQPGVFHDPEKDLLLFAHRFFRRSLSHKNKFNEYFLSSFLEADADLGTAVTPRLRLDPDVIGHPLSAGGLLELEYWHGPRYNDDIASISSGVSEHKASDRDRLFEGVDKTHIWWKSPETRREDDQSVKYRTFEIEELIENLSGGLGDQYGCRYAHAEYSLDSRTITHFDGAIRAYPEEQYLERIEKLIDRAGKHSNYTKLFRFDGTMPVNRWKRLLSDYFRGNALVPEYLGAEPQDEETPAHVEREDAVNASQPSALCAFISLLPWQATHRFAVESTDATLPDGHRIQVVETGAASVEKFLRGTIDLEDITTAGYTDGRWNLARMVFGHSTDFPNYMYDTMAGVSMALRDDIDHGRVNFLAVAISWPYQELQVTLSIRGPADAVERLLAGLFSMVDATKPPSDWIEPFSSKIKNMAPISMPSNDFSGLQEGILSVERTETGTCQLSMPETVLDQLRRDGFTPTGVISRPIGGVTSPD